jgi:phosphotriesterase-related protein
MAEAPAASRPAARTVVRTVGGPVPVDRLGPTLMHEHLFLDFRCRYRPRADLPDDLGDLLALRDRWRVVADPAAYAANLRREDPEDAVAELDALRDAGGTCVVDVTPRGLGPRWSALREVADRTGVTVVAGTGFYVHSTHTPELHAADRSRIAEQLAQDVLVGDADGVRAGIIGELGVDDFLPCETGVVLAAAAAQAACGASVAVHTLAGALPEARPATLALVRAFIDAGGDPTRLILCHHDGTGDDRAYQDALLREGVVLSYDTFGFEAVFRRGDTFVQLPTDSRRIGEVADLFDRGWGDQVVVSHDLCYRMMTRAWGGWGLAHLLTTLVPRFEAAGLDRAARDRLLVGTPARLLALPAD